ncbi:hypothetical protein HC928_01150 [bacterium]|nr:hypothetical protein [bacterium]
MPAASELHTAICAYLTYVLVQYLAEQSGESVARSGIGVCTAEATSRIPNIVICPQSL